MESSNLQVARLILFILAAIGQVGYCLIGSWMVAQESRADGASVELGLSDAIPGAMPGAMDDTDNEEFPESSFGKPPAQAGQVLKAYSFVPTKKDLGRKLASEGVTADPLKKALTRNQAVQEVALIADDVGFIPRKISVTQGVPVRLFVTSASKKTLCLMIDQFEVRKQIRSQHVEEISFVPEGREPVRFYCPINGKEGFLYVKDPNPGVQGS